MFSITALKPGYVFIGGKSVRLDLAVYNSDNYNRSRNFYLQFKVRRKAASSQLTQDCDQLTEEDVIS